jgi:hypothetical protein
MARLMQMGQELVVIVDRTILKSGFVKVAPRLAGDPNPIPRAVGKKSKIRT